MGNGFIVYRGRGWEKRYFDHFYNGIPCVTNMQHHAMIFEHREMAEDVVKQCEKYTGRKFEVLALTETE